MAAWMLTAALLSPVITLIGVAFMAGTFKQRIVNVENDQTNHVRRMDGQDLRMNGHEQQLASHAEQLAEGRGWRKGFDAARVVSSKSEG